MMPAPDRPKPPRFWAGLTLPAPTLAAGLLAFLVIVREVTQMIARGKLPVSDDFRFYWAALERFRADPTTLYVPASIMDLRGFLYPPPAIAFFLPLSLFPRAVAGGLFRVAGILAMIGSTYLLSDLFAANDVAVRPRDRLCLILIALAFGATYANAWYGQVNTFVLFDCLAFRLLLDRRRPAVAGAVLAAGAWLKVYPVVCLIFVVLWERRFYDVRRVVLGFAAGAVGIVLICLPFVPVSLYRIYFTDTFVASASGTFQNILNQSFLGAAARTLVPASDFVDWEKCPHSVVPQMWARIANGAMALAAVAWLGWQARTQSPTRRMLAFLCLLAVIPIVSPLGWAYVYVLATPVLLFAILRAPRTLPSLGILLALCMALFVPATYEVPRLGRLPDVLQHIFYDRYMLLTVLVGASLLWAENRSTLRPRYG